MKKVFRKSMFLILVCLVFTMLSLLLPAPFIAEPENVDYITLSQENFNEQISGKPDGKFRLESDITLQEWAPINFSGELDGNGYKISLNRSFLFKELSNATIKNLNFQSANTITFDTSESYSDTNLGLLAQTALSTKIESVNISGSLEVEAYSSTYIGGMFGFAQNCSIKNSLVKTEIEIHQNSVEALKTIAGGLIGFASGCKIENCFVTPIRTYLIDVVVKGDLISPQTDLIVGGLVGEMQKSSVGHVVNAFCQGLMAYTFVQIAENQDMQNKLMVGLIFGEISGFTAFDQSLDCVYFLSSQTFPLVANANEGNVSGLASKNADLFTVAQNYQTVNSHISWNELYEWDFEKIWTKKTTEIFPVLQVFENFNVSVDNTPNEHGITCEVLNYNGEAFVPTDETSFKYGTTVMIGVSIENDFKNYKSIQALHKNDSNESFDLTFSDERDYATYTFEINAYNAGLYYATSQNIEYKLLVKTESAEKGFVKYGTSNNRLEERLYTLVYGGEYTFVADPIDSSFAFDSWKWVGESGDIDAIRGAADSQLLANRAVTIAFGTMGSDSGKTYLGFGDGWSVPYTKDEVTGEIIFTIKATFTANVANLAITSNTTREAFELYVGGVLVNNIVSYETVFNDNVQIGRALSIEIVMKDGFKFNGWSSVDGSAIEAYLAEGESSSQKSINLTINNNFILHIDVLEENEVENDLTWLWFVIGGVTLLGLIVLIVVLVVKKRRNSTTFLTNY